MRKRTRRRHLRVQPEATRDSKEWVVYIHIEAQTMEGRCVLQPVVTYAKCVTSEKHTRNMSNQGETRKPEYKAVIHTNTITHTHTHVVLYIRALSKVY